MNSQFLSFWIPKRTAIGSPDWVEKIVATNTCPNQRKYRRMTRSERIQFSKERKSNKDQ